jgi:hypothetical protein
LVPSKYGKLLSTIFFAIFGIGLAGSLTMAQDNSSFNIDANLDTVYNYSFYRNNLPVTGQTETTLNIDSALLLGSYQYKLKCTGNSGTNAIELNKATMCRMIGRTFFEVGNKDWTWGQGYRFSPTYPMMPNNSYWGGQATVAWLKYDFIVGTADNGEDNGGLDTAWFKADFIKETSDYGIVLSCQDGNDQNHQNLGVTFSKDMQNGIQIHGEYNLRYPDADTEYLIGGLYTGAKHVINLEYYNGIDNFTIFLSYSQLKIDMENYYSVHPQGYNNYILLNFNNSTNEPNHWQWEIGGVANLLTSDVLSYMSLKYTGDEKITPHISITNYTGPLLGQIPYYLGISLGLNIKF